jgi:hypothetical protein
MNKKYILFIGSIVLILLFFCPLSTQAGEGHHWSRLTSEAKLIVVLMFDSGYSKGRLRSIDDCTCTLFSDPKTQYGQYIKLSYGIKLRGRLETRADYLSAVQAIDKAYSLPGAVDIPMSILIDIAINTIKEGKIEIPDNIVTEWVKNVNYQPEIK